MINLQNFMPFTVWTRGGNSGSPGVHDVLPRSLGIIVGMHRKQTGESDLKFDFKSALESQIPIYKRNLKIQITTHRLQGRNL